MSIIKRLFNKTRTPKNRTAFGKAALFSVLILAAGLFSGYIIKLFDIYTELLGNIFSGISVWILICTIIAVFSSTPKRAAVNVFLYCLGMIAAYYVTAQALGAAYSMSFVYGWSVFTLFTPIFAFFAWYGRGRGWLSVVITALIIAFMLTATLVMFGLRVYDLIFAVGVGGVMVFKKDRVR